MVSIQRHSLVSPWVVALYLGLGAIIVAVALFSELPLDREGGPLSFLDAFLVFVMAGLLLALGTYGEWRTPMRAGYLLGMVLALGIGIIQLVGLLDGETPLVEELDTGDTLCWLIAGFFLVWMLRSAKQLRSAERFLILGFVLQSFSLVADLTDGMSVELPDLFDWLFGAGEEISEVLFLATYCCGFALLVNRSTAETLRWRQQGLRAYDMLEPALVIKRAHLALRWRRRGVAGHAMAALQNLAAPLSFCTQLALHVAQNGQRIRRGLGKSRPRQAIEAVLLGLGAGVPAANYYKFDLFMACNRKLARHFLHRGEFKGRLGINRLFRRLPGARSPLGDRFAFAVHCLEHGLPTIPILAHGSGGKLLLTAPDDDLPPADLLTRPNKGSGGVERWRFSGAAWRNEDGIELSAMLLLERIARSTAQDGTILQPLRRNHAALGDLAGDGLATVRVITCLDESGRPEITHAVLRMAKNSNAAGDDFHAGGVAAAVDIAEGRLGWATDLGLRGSIGWIRRHPESDAVITGTILPHWRLAKALALRAHQACLDRTVIGWDIAILQDGVELVDGSAIPDLDIIQRTHSKPLGLDRLGQLMAWHVRDGLR